MTERPYGALSCPKDPQHNKENDDWFEEVKVYPKVCLTCRSVLVDDVELVEVSWEDGTTRLTPTGLNPMTGRMEDQPEETRILAAFLTRMRGVSAASIRAVMARGQGELSLEYPVEAAVVFGDKAKEYRGLIFRPKGPVKRGSVTEDHSEQTLPEPAKSGPQPVRDFAERVFRLNSAEFAMVCHRVGCSSGILPGSAAPLRARAVAFLDWVEAWQAWEKLDSALKREGK